MAEACAPEKKHQFTHQGRLIYEWDQTFSEVNVYVQVPPGTPAKALFCDFTQHSLQLGMKPNPPYLQGQLCGQVKVGESVWTLEGGIMTISLQKLENGEPWPAVFVGHELDPVEQQEEAARLMRERFQQEHPGFDFSGASFNGQVPNPRTFMGGARIN